MGEPYPDVRRLKSCSTCHMRFINVIHHSNRHGRDNKLHVWKTIFDVETRIREAATQLELPIPELEYSMDVNALNYCRFSIFPLSEGRRTDNAQALIAVPNLVESSLVCIGILSSSHTRHSLIL